MEEEDFLQQSRFAICHCRECQRPFAVQKEIDYAIALLRHNGDTRAELHRESFETCRNASARNAWCRPIVLN